MFSISKWIPIACWSCLICVSTTAVCVATPPKSRAEFAATAGKVLLGMKEEEVLKLLGPPDTVSARDFGTTGSMPNLAAVWLYGTSENGFPSWGRVYFTQEPHVLDETSLPEVARVYGGEGAPPARFEEKRLRHLLSLISAVPRMDGEEFDPGCLIQAVNELWPLGKDGALLVIEEYLRVSPVNAIEDVEKMGLLLRALSEIPEPPGYLPLPTFGSFGPPPPEDLREAPRFPLMIVKGVPLLLLLVGGFVTGGPPPEVEEDLQWFRRQAELRKQPLRPTDEPWRVLEQAKSLPAWKVFAEDSAGGEAMLRMQILRLLSRTQELEIKAADYQSISDEQWSQVLTDVKQKTKGQSLQWDAERGCYTLKP